MSTMSETEIARLRRLSLSHAIEKAHAEGNLARVRELRAELDCVPDPHA